MALTIELSPSEEARLAAIARQEGLLLDEWARKVVTEHLLEAPEELGQPIIINRAEPPFRQDPRLMGIRFHEDPAMPLDLEDWPEAFQ
jgi:hypothetical protein